MTQIQTVTAQELKGAAHLQFPPDLTWEADYHIREHQQTGTIRYHDIAWEYALDHQYMGIEQILTGEAERYIYDTLEGGVHVAHSFELTLKDGHITVLASMHPSVKHHRSGWEAMENEVLAKAEIRVTFESQRTNTLVRAALEQQYRQDKPQDLSNQTGLLGPHGQLPEGLDMEMEYTVLLEPSTQALGQRPGDIDWTGALNDGGTSLRAVLAGEHTCVIEEMGGHQAFNFTFSVNDRNLVVAHGTLHPALEPDMDPDQDEVLASADIILAPRDHRAGTALHQYVKRHHPEQ